MAARPELAAAIASDRSEKRSLRAVRPAGRFALDEAALDQAYRRVQAQVHPDRFAAAGAAKRRVAMQWAARANEAYRTLRSPVTLSSNLRNSLLWMFQYTATVASTTATTAIQRRPGVAV